MMMTQLASNVAAALAVMVAGTFFPTAPLAAQQDAPTPSEAKPETPAEPAQKPQDLKPNSPQESPTPAQDPERRAGPGGGGVGFKAPIDPSRTAGQLVIDAKTLKSVYSKALAPLQKHLEDSKLDARYAEIKELLQEETVDTARLIQSLRGLKSELDTFVGDLPEIREKLFDGSDALVNRITDFRLALARNRDKTRDQTKVTEGKIDPTTALDRELTTLAREIKAAENPNRKTLLKKRFKSKHIQRQRLKALRPQLGGLDETIMANVLDFIVNIRFHLDEAVMQTIAMQIDIKNEQDAVRQFLDLIETLHQTDRLAEEIRDLTKVQGPDFSKLSEQMAEVSQGLLGYTDQLERKTGSLTGDLADALQKSTPGAPVDDAELDRLIDEASAQGLPNDAPTTSDGTIRIRNR